MRIRVQESQINASVSEPPDHQHGSENSKNTQIRIRIKPELPRTLFSLVTNGSGSGRPKNMRIRVQIRIPINNLNIRILRIRIRIP